MCDESVFRYCPCCNKEIGVVEIENGLISARTHGLKTLKCPSCGRAPLDDFYYIMSGKHREMLARQKRGEQVLYQPPALPVFLPDLVPSKNRDSGSIADTVAKVVDRAKVVLKRKPGRPKKVVRRAP